MSQTYSHRTFAALKNSDYLRDPPEGPARRESSPSDSARTPNYPGEFKKKSRDADPRVKTVDYRLESKHRHPPANLESVPETAAESDRKAAKNTAQNAAQNTAPAAEELSREGYAQGSQRTGRFAGTFGNGALQEMTLAPQDKKFRTLAKAGEKGRREGSFQEGAMRSS